MKYFREEIKFSVTLRCVASNGYIITFKCIKFHYPREKRNYLNYTYETLTKEN